MGKVNHPRILKFGSFNKPISINQLFTWKVTNSLIEIGKNCEISFIEIGSSLIEIRIYLINEKEKIEIPSKIKQMKGNS